MATSYIGSTTGYETFGTTSPVTGSAPTTSATDGLPLADVDAITVVIDTADTRTLSGAGTLDCYIYDPEVSFASPVWTRFPAGDLSVTGTARQQGFEPFEVVCKRGRIKWVPTGVTFSAGSAGVTVTMLGYSKIARNSYR